MLYLSLLDKNRFYFFSCQRNTFWSTIFERQTLSFSCRVFISLAALKNLENNSFPSGVIILCSKIVSKLSLFRGREVLVVFNQHANGFYLPTWSNKIAGNNYSQLVQKVLPKNKGYCVMLQKKSFLTSVPAINPLSQSGDKPEL